MIGVRLLSGLLLPALLVGLLSLTVSAEKHPLLGPLRMRDMTPWEILRLGDWAFENQLSHANTYVAGEVIRNFLKSETAAHRGLGKTSRRSNTESRPLSLPTTEPALLMTSACVG